MSKKFRTFPNGNPPQDDDIFLFSRADGTSPTGFSNYTLTWLQLKTAAGVPTVTSYLLLNAGGNFLLNAGGALKING